MSYDLARLKSSGTDVFISGSVEIKRPHLVEVRSHTAIDTGFYITTAAEIGNFVHIGPYVTCIGGETAKLLVRDFVGISAGVRIICKGDSLMGAGIAGPNIPDDYRDETIGSTTSIERFAVIGTNVVVLPGVSVGEGSVIGAGAVLTRDAEPWTIYVGNPAKPVKERSRQKIIEFGKEICKRYTI